MFARTSDLVQKLQLARRELAIKGAINRLDRFHLLILDDLAYVSKDQAETSVLFELISARLRAPLHPHHRQPAVRRMGQGLPRCRHDAGRRRPPRPSRHDLRNQRRQLQATRRPRTKTKRRRTTAKLRDNQGYQRLVAQRQSNSNSGLATDNHTEHHPIVAVTNRSKPPPETAHPEGVLQ